jgi:hypothetical protein
MKKLFLGSILITVVFFTACKPVEIDDSQLGVRNIKIELAHRTGVQNFAIGVPNVNTFGETYTLNRFQYYISNVALINTNTNKEEKEMESYHLIDADNVASTKFNFSTNWNNYNALVFYVGVDSLRNVSGAQTGALDPLNGMFWTWNSGYIMAKMEGSSPVSTEANNELLFHIGGYSGINNAIRKVVLNFPNGSINTPIGGTCLIKLNVDINKWFNGVHNIKIADGALAMSVSSRTKNFADNYATMFTVESVVNQ